MASAGLKAKARLGRLPLQDVDRYVGARMRERRILLGLSQHQLAPLIGVSYQQAQKYEYGVNRISAGRLFVIARALGVGVGYFVDGMDVSPSFEPTPQQRALFELAHNFISMPTKYQEAISRLARVLADPKLALNVDFEGGAARPQLQLTFAAAEARLGP